MTGFGQDGPLAQARRPRHQLHRARRRAARHRPQGRGAGAAAQPRRRLRRRRHVPRLRRGVRAARGAEVGQGPGGRRRHGRRRRLSDGAASTASTRRASWADERGVNFARFAARPGTTSTRPRTASGCRSAPSRSASTRSWSRSWASASAELPKQHDRKGWPVLRRALRRGDRRARRATNGSACSRAATPASPRCWRWARSRHHPAQRGARHLRAARRRAAAGPRAALLAARRCEMGPPRAAARRRQRGRAAGLGLRARRDRRAEEGRRRGGRLIPGVSGARTAKLARPDPPPLDGEGLGVG